MRNRVVYTGIVIFLSLLAGLVANVLYIKHVDRQNDRRDIKRSHQICEVAVFIDDRNQTVSSPNPDQKAFIEKWHQYRVSLDCPK